MAVLMVLPLPSILTIHLPALPLSNVISIHCQ